MTTMLRALEVSAGWHPSERMVVVPVEDGTETVFVDQHSLQGGYLLVQDTDTSEEGHRLVELPREAMSGSWRVWVDAADLRQAADS